MKSPMYLWREVAIDFGHRCRVSTIRDFKTVSDRTNTEGLSFLTITLPSFAKDFDEALDLGKVDHAHFAGFSRREGTPRFLGGFLDLVFERSTGVLLASPNLEAIRAIRQLTRLVSKIELECSDERTKSAFKSFWSIEDELEGLEIEQEALASFARISKLLYGGVLHRMDYLCGGHALIPKHGPGATADKLLGNQKFGQAKWHWRLEFGGLVSTDFLLPNPRYHSELQGVEFVDPEDEQPVKVTAVPKTLKTPRIIAIEPTCMQYAQQAIAEPLVEILESDFMTRDLLGFTDQGPNRDLAQRGSFDGSLATLDLSEASDRVSNQLVKILAHGYTHFSEAIQACRSLRAEVPGLGVRPLSKFASMGSALCFPIEAMVFLAIVFVGIERAQDARLKKSDILSLSSKVRIYGDDIIVPVEYARSVSETLEDFGLKVNSHKSFWNGNFRESCGKDFFLGHDVSVVKIRRILPKTRKDVDGIVSAVSLRNQLFDAGLYGSVSYLDRILGAILKYYPEVERTSSVLGRYTHSVALPDGYDSRYHRPTVKGWTVVSKIPDNRIDGLGALLKYFLKRGDLPVVDPKHLERSGRPLAVGIKLVNGSIR